MSGRQLSSFYIRIGINVMSSYIRQPLNEHLQPKQMNPLEPFKTAEAPTIIGSDRACRSGGVNGT